MRVCLAKCCRGKKLHVDCKYLTKSLKYGIKCVLSLTEIREAQRYFSAFANEWPTQENKNALPHQVIQVLYISGNDVKFPKAGINCQMLKQSHHHS